jgi:hypothetical protein
MAIEHDRPFDAVAPSDITELFDELDLPRPKPLWYVGRLDERVRSGNGNGARNPANASATNGNTASHDAEPDVGDGKGGSAHGQESPPPVQDATDG